MTTGTLVKYQAKTERVKVSNEALRELTSAGKEVTLAVLNNPALTIIISAVLIEWLQTIEVKRQVQAPGGVGPPSTVSQPLISQGLATTMESVIISAAAITSLSSALGGAQGIGSLLKLLK